MKDCLLKARCNPDDTSDVLRMMHDKVGKFGTIHGQLYLMNGCSFKPDCGIVVYFLQCSVDDITRSYFVNGELAYQFVLNGTTDFRELIVKLSDQVWGPNEPVPTESASPWDNG